LICEYAIAVEIDIRGWLDVSMWETFIVPAKVTYDVARAYKKWYDQVKTGGPWDHKKIIKKAFGDWSLDDAQKRLYFFDIWSNIHYGYVGVSCGFPEDDLLAGAGLAQWMAGTVPPGTGDRISDPSVSGIITALDDPQDQGAIKVGLELWDTYKQYLLPDYILNVVRRYVKVLDTKPA